MAFQSWTINSSFRSSGFPSLFDPFPHSLLGFDGVTQGGPPSALVLDNERGELVKAPARVGKKETLSEEKAMMALKNHSEAERRRRERINTHLGTLRGLVPCTDKMEKAALLAEVINQVKKLKKNALESSKGFMIPTDTDEVRVEPLDDEIKNGKLFFKTSICCEYKPDLMSDLTQAIDSLHLSIVEAEMTTLGNRVKNVFVFSSNMEEEKCNVSQTTSKIVADSIHRAMSCLVDNVSNCYDYSPRTPLSNKRRRISFLDSSSSSL